MDKGHGHRFLFEDKIAFINGFFYSFLLCHNKCMLFIKSLTQTVAMLLVISDMA